LYLKKEEEKLKRKIAVVKWM